MASAVESLGMQPYFIISPGHAFLGVALNSSGASLEYWETSDLSGGLNGNASDGVSANTRGDLEYSLFSSHGKILDIVDVQYERQQGIMPIE